MTVSHTLCGECGSVLLICSRPDCGKPFPRRRHEDELSWGARVYCGLECAAADRQVVRFAGRVLAQKPCGRKGCDNMATQRRNESPASFQARKYCGPECGFIARRIGEQAKSEAKKISDREYQRRKREARRAGIIPPKAKPGPKPKLEPELAAQVDEPVKQLIRTDVKIVNPEPVAELWRPAAWRAMDAARRG